MKHSSLIGQTLSGRYKIEELLGQGGMSSVYRAMDPNLRRVVAIKMVHPHLSNDPSFIKRFEEEAAAIASLRHPNIVQVFDFNTDEETNYMVMEFVPGETLQTRLKRLNDKNRKMPVSEAVNIINKVCDGLSYAHKRGMVHRDVKPANIMLDINNQPILMDFGIVKIVGSAAHTLTGAVVGTANYMAPEVIRSEPADQRSDIYALGITLFEMLSGKPPFDADSAMTIMMMHLNDPLPNLEEVRNDLPKGFIKILEKMLAKDRNDRYQTAEEVANDLSKLEDKVSTEIFDSSEILKENSEKLELETPTQITPPMKMEHLDDTLVEDSEKTNIIEEVPATMIDKTWIEEGTSSHEKKANPKRGLVALIVGLLIVSAAFFIGFSTSWFGLAEKNSDLDATSTQKVPAVDQINVNENATSEALAIKITAEAEKEREIEAAQQVNQERFLVCQITDSGSIAGSPFLESVFIGLERSERELGVAIDVLESNEDDYEMHLNQFIDRQCNLIISVGYILGDITIHYAEKYPDTKFSIIDFQANIDLPNFSNQVFQIDQAAFLAGYLAASVTETGKVATYGGMQIPPVEMFMDGFARGVQFYNETKAQNVQLLGWDVNTHTGVFVDSFDNLDVGVEMANEFLNQDVDIIFPVAGQVGLGSALVMMERNTGLLIGVDNDWAINYPEFAPIILTSTVKNLDNTVFNVIQQAVEGNFSKNRFVGNLENEGVGLAPFHELEPRIPEEVKAELMEIRELIIAGQIEFFPDYQYE